MGDKQSKPVAGRRKDLKTVHYDEWPTTTANIPKKERALVCVSIDFGTTYSGFAYSFKSDPNHCFGQHKKFPTVVLLDPEQKVVAFGTAARDKYKQLTKTREHTNWYLFERFKMALFVNDEPLSKDIELKDVDGKKMKAFDVFTQAIALMTTEVMNTLNGVYMNMHQRNGLEFKSETDIHWVLTVPAIWDDLAKKFMRDSASKAGIPDEMLTIALEPEVASLYCLEKLGLSKLPTGHRFMIMDLGGGTADITMHEVNADRTLSELHQPTGGDFGGTKSVMRRRFGDMITIPLEPSQAVLNGAVVYGHRPLAIAERVCKYTYGIGRMMKFKPHHPAHRKVKIDGLDYCDGIFNKHIEVGTKIRVAEDAEKAVVHKYFPTTTAMKQAVLDVYASPFKDPMFVDDHGCQLVGLIKLDIDSHGDIYSELLVKMMFGGTELQVQVTDVKNNKITNASFGFLG
ncbi:heat shock 70 kDa protein 12B-like [Dreissena polymorpha]|uniref:heat shock 70 kDa protein 12B-like n=1 Tax=Dreissena polymorpha TaxID=45954 RepID=UPI002264E591|nr:heat shock 70 kDa protein 12B-like [Dreissena polymorpha]